MTNYKKEKEYTCAYCGNSFIAEARCKSKQSNTIQCPFCSNCIPTWDDKIERLLMEDK